MTWKIELSALAVTAAAVAGYLYQADPFASAPITYHDQFTEADYHAFDRGFEMGDEYCEIGLQVSQVCLPKFKADTIVRVGEKLPQDVPSLSAGMRVLLALESKQPELKTVRFGQTLVLIEPGTEIVRDVMRLDAPSYEAARGSGLRVTSAGVAAN